MRKLYNDFFYIPKHGKMREKVMLTRVVMSIVIIVVCLGAMSITAYAYFSHNIISGINTIKAANFETNVTVQITDTDGKVAENSNITPSTSDHKKFIVEGLEVGKWYNFTINPSDSNTAQTGFIIVSAEGCKVTYHTQQLGVDKKVKDGETPQIRFKLMITDATKVILESHWGTSSYYPAYQIESEEDERYITLDEEITMIINDQTEPNVSKENNEGSDDSTDEKDTSEIISNDTTTPPTTQNTTLPAESTTTSEQTTTPETTGTSESTTTSESSSSTELSDPTNITELATTDLTDTTVSTETQGTEETSSASTTETSE